MTARAIASICAALTVAGCGLKDPYNDPTPTPKPPQRKAAPAAATVTPAAPTAAPPTERTALERFARTWSNWNWDGLSRVRLQLIGQAAGELRAELRRDVDDQTDDAAMSPNALSSSGHVEGVMLRSGKPALVVTEELTKLANGDETSNYVVYLAQAQRTPDGWKVVSWQPVQ